MSQDSKFLFGDDENTSRNIQSKQDRKQKRVHRRKHNPKKSRLTKKTISIHPFAMIGVSLPSLDPLSSQAVRTAPHFRTSFVGVLFPKSCIFPIYRVSYVVVM